MLGGDMPFCPQCGASYDDTASFCPSCGRPLKGQTPSDPAPAAEKVDPAGEALTPRIRTRIPRFVKDAVSPAEPILAAFNASLFDHHKQGVSLAHDKFVLTPQRIIYYHTGLFHKAMGEMPYRMITGVSYERGMVHGKVIVEAANAGLTLDGIGNDDAAFAEKIIAAGMAGKPLTASGPAMEPALIPPVILVLVLIVIVAALVAILGVPHIPFVR